MSTFKSLIGQFEDREALAAALGVRRSHIAAFKNRDSIPAAYWLRLIAHAEVVGVEGVTAESLARLAAKPLAESAA